MSPNLLPGRRERIGLPAGVVNVVPMTAAELEAAVIGPAERVGVAVEPPLVAELVAWTRTLMQSGAALAHTIPGRAGWELRLVVQGGLRILEKIEALGFATLHDRPRLHAADAPLLLWRALWMRPARGPIVREAA